MATLWIYARELPRRPRPTHHRIRSLPTLAVPTRLDPSHTPVKPKRRQHTATADPLPVSRGATARVVRIDARTRGGRAGSSGGVGSPATSQQKASFMLSPDMADFDNARSIVVMWRNLVTKKSTVEAFALKSAMISRISRVITDATLLGHTVIRTDEGERSGQRQVRRRLIRRCIRF